MPQSSLIGLAAVIFGCASVAPMKSGVLIDEYFRAECVQPHRYGHSRWQQSWDEVVQGPGGCTARVVGTVDVVGFVAVEYPPDDIRHRVTHFGEKSNPIDVRVDLASCRLYVWSTGSPIFNDQPPTWLLEYDLRDRRELQSVTVDYQAMPACPDS